jgi:hypothetical protein
MIPNAFKYKFLGLVEQMTKGLQRILHIAAMLLNKAGQTKHSIDKSSYGDIGGEMLSKMINLTNAAGCAGPELLSLQHRSQPSFEMGSWPSVRGSFLRKSLAGGGQLPNPPGVEARTNLHSAAFWRGVCSVTVDLDVSCCIGEAQFARILCFAPTIGEEKTPRAEERSYKYASMPTDL